MLIFGHVSTRFGATQTVVGLVGHNGAGKSTLTRRAVGPVRPDAVLDIVGLAGAAPLEDAL